MRTEECVTCNKIRPGFHSWDSITLDSNFSITITNSNYCLQCQRDSYNKKLDLHYEKKKCNTCKEIKTLNNF